jgi:hypothetical protein
VVAIILEFAGRKMPENARDNLLARLAGKSTAGGDGPSWATISTTQPQHAQGASRVVPDTIDAPPPGSSKEGAEGRLEHLLKRISTLAVEQGAAKAQAVLGTAPGNRPPDAFMPIEPQTWAEAQLTEVQVESIILKFLLSRGTCTGREAADQVKLTFKLIDELMRQLKADQLVFYSGAAPMNDYNYQLTDMGRERARRHSLECTYFGSAPVSLSDYIASVKAQSLTLQHPTTEDLRMAFQDLLINNHMLDRLGPAINSGRGLFLYGAPGNGKTSIAERITMAFGDAIWIPRAIGIDGEIIRLFDPSNHEELPLEQAEGLLDQRRIDKRWIRIRRPTIVVGGELTMANLEVTLNTSTGISEASLQMKSNCGTLVIDDFGRQRMRTDELLNRWIVPLEKRYDYLNLPNGKKIQVPFDQLIVFSTNLQPKDLVDDAFLRRIPYKIDVTDPSEEEFRELFRIMAPKLGMEYRDEPVEYLIEKYYRRVKRPFRCCQPRDLLTQVRNYCLYKNIRPEITADYFDVAVENYFAVM